MDWKKGRPLGEGQTDRPLLWRESLGEAWLSSSTISAIIRDAFGAGRGKSLRTWGRDEASPDGPHWIGVRNGTTLHTDPRYPRYTHQWVIHNGGWFVGGFDCRIDGDPFVPGTLFSLDTHSPHVLMPDSRVGTGIYYLAISIDSPVPLGRDAILGPMRGFLGRSRH